MNLRPSGIISNQADKTKWGSKYPYAGVRKKSDSTRSSIPLIEPPPRLIFFFFLRNLIYGCKFTLDINILNLAIVFRSVKPEFILILTAFVRLRGHLGQEVNENERNEKR